MQDTISKPSHQLLQNMIAIKGGRFMMGDDASGHRHEKPAHPVTVPDFHLCQYPVTQDLWAAVMGKNPTYFKGENRPVEQVSWEDIREENGFLDRLNALPEIEKHNKQHQKKFRLPTEAQWEYAARGGQDWEQFPYRYAGSNNLHEVAWSWENGHHQTKPVGLKMPNRLGLYDMNGNVWEWCEDTWQDNYKDAPDDGSAQLDRNEGIRVVRGGSWISYYNYCTVSIRYYIHSNYRVNYIGFRLAWY